MSALDFLMTVIYVTASAIWVYTAIAVGREK